MTTEKSDLKVGDKIHCIPNGMVSTVTDITDGNVTVDYEGKDNHIPLATLMVHVRGGDFEIIPTT